MLFESGADICPKPKLVHIFKVQDELETILRWKISIDSELLGTKNVLRYLRIQREP